MISTSECCLPILFQAIQKFCMLVPGCSDYHLVGFCQGGGEVRNDIRGLHLYK